MVKKLTDFGYKEYLIDEIKPKEHGFHSGAESAIFIFHNGYGASVINDGYGGNEGLFEVALIKSNKQGWWIDYDNDKLKDVSGFLDDKGVKDHLAYIKAKEPYHEES